MQRKIVGWIGARANHLLVLGGLGGLSRKVACWLRGSMTAGKGLFLKGSFEQGDRREWRVATKYVFSISQAQHGNLLGNCSNY